MARGGRVWRASALVVVALVVAAGCSESKKKAVEPDEDSSGANGSQPEEPKGPTYDGPAIPGLGAEQAWSLPLPTGSSLEFSDAAQVTVVGFEDSFAVIYDDPEPPATDEDLVPADGNFPRVIDFLDAESGERIERLELSAETAGATTWHGEPALEVRSSVEKPSDGLSAAEMTTTVAILDGQGEELGQVEHPAADGPFKVEDGWLLEPKGQGALVNAVDITPVEGGPTRTVTVPDSLGATLSLNEDRDDLPAEMATTDGKTRLLAGGFAFTQQPADDVMRLAAIDLATGETAWTSADVGRHPEAEAEADVSGVYVDVLAATDDRVLLSWEVATDGIFDDRRAVSTNDLRTGELIAAGPVVEGGLEPRTTRVAPDGELAAVANSMTDPFTTVWDVATGEQLWQQAEDENNLVPDLFVGAALFGYRQVDLAGGKSAPIAVDARTKEVLEADLADDQVPRAATTSGFGVIVTDDGIFAFPPP